MSTQILKLDGVSDSNKNINTLIYKRNPIEGYGNPIVGLNGGVASIDDGNLIVGIGGNINFGTVDWTVPHVIKIKDLNYITYLKLESLTPDCLIELSDFSDNNQITNLTLNDTKSPTISKLGGVSGDLSDLKNCSKLKTLSLAGQGNITGDIANLINTSIGSVAIQSSLVYGEVAALPASCHSVEISHSGYPYFNAYKRKYLTYSDNTVRASSAFEALGLSGYFKSAEDVENYLIATSNCAWAGRTYGKTIDVTFPGDFTPTQEVLDAISNLATNMYNALDDSERTQGTYFTSIKVNGVEYVTE